MFDFQNAELNKNSYKETIKPGIHVVKITSVTNGVSAQKQAPFLEFTAESIDGSAELKQQYYLSTTVNPGKQKSAWDISKNAILSLVAASNSLDEETAKSKMPSAKSAEELAQKLAMLIIGKEFRLKVNGEEKISQKGTKYVASNFANGVFCESSKSAETKLVFSADKNIKKLPIDAAPQVQEGFSSPADDLPAF
jgi:hypothetical protein